MAKKVLFITRKLRPYNGPEAFQSTMIAKYLSMNCETHVISTTKNPQGIGNAEHYFITENETRSVSSKIESIFSRMGVNVKLSFKSADTAWIDVAIRKAENVIRNENIQTVITRSSPATTHLIGLGILPENAGIRWVCSMSDPITINPYIDIILPRAKNELLEYERKIFEEADVITHTNVYLADEYLKIYPQHRGKFYVLSNMFDREIVENERAMKLKFWN